MTDWLLKRFVKDYRNTGDQRVRAAYGLLGSLTGVAVNLLLSLTKLLVGLRVGSVAVVADAANNFSDAGGSVISLISMRMAQKPTDAEHPFGHGRLEYIGALGVGVLILIMGVELLRSGVEAIITPEPVQFSWLSVALLSLSVCVKFWLSLFYHKLGAAVNAATLTAAGEDSRSDVFATFAVIVSMLLGHFSHWNVDGVMGVLVSLVVLKAGYEVISDTVSRLLGGKPDAALGRRLTEMLLAYDGVLGVHDLVLHDYGPGRCVASVHAEVSASANIVEIHEKIDRAEREISQALHLPLCIHMDPIISDDPAANAVRVQLMTFLAGMRPPLKLHDFRMVPGEQTVNLIFDVALPPGYDGKDELRKRIEGYARELDARYRCVITFDTEYFFMQ